MSLFRQVKIRYLNIVVNDKMFRSKFEKLFDSSDELNAITFISSPRFFLN